jgi:transcriptional regulator with XRE-family HTH domain
MDIGERLKQCRESKGLSQAQVEQRSKLLRCYVSRVENGHTVPTIETLDKFAFALEMPLYQLFYEGKESPEIPRTDLRGAHDWASKGRGKRIFAKLQKAIRKMTPRQRVLLLYAAEKIISTSRVRKSRIGLRDGERRAQVSSKDNASSLQ